MMLICLLSMFSVVLAGNYLSGNSIYYCQNRASVKVPCKVIVSESSHIVYWAKEHDTGFKIVASKTLSLGERDAPEPRYKMAKDLSLIVYNPVEGEEFRCYVDKNISAGTTIKLATYKEPDVMGVDGCDTYPCMIAFDIASTEGLTCGSSGHIPNNQVHITWNELTNKDLMELYQSKRVYDVQTSVKVKTVTTVSCLIEGQALCGQSNEFDVIIFNEGTFNKNFLTFCLIVISVPVFMAFGCKCIIEWRVRRRLKHWYQICGCYCFFAVLLLLFGSYM